MPGQIQIVVPDKSGGVLDYASCLVDSLPSASLIRVGKESCQQWEVPQGTNVYLQMSGYGYSKRGAPLWLLGEVSKRRSRMLRLGVFFHELYAKGKPWQSSFWVSPLQKWVVSRLASDADFWLTNREASAEWLRERAHTKGAVLPVFSNVGEIAEQVPDRETEDVVFFGGSVVRESTYARIKDSELEKIAATGGTIHDVGPPVSLMTADRLQRLGVRIHGPLPASEVSAIMASVTFGVLAYRAEELEKSSIFAAYCAHGLCPVVIGESCEAADQLKADRHYLTTLSSRSDTREIASNAWQWYQSHTLATASSIVAERFE